MDTARGANPPPVHGGTRSAEQSPILASQRSRSRAITIRFDVIVDKLKQMEEQESGEAWLDDQDREEEDDDDARRHPEREVASNHQAGSTKNPFKKWKGRKEKKKKREVAEAKEARTPPVVRAGRDHGEEEGRVHRRQAPAAQDRAEDGDGGGGGEESGLTPRPGSSGSLTSSGSSSGGDVRGKRRMDVIFEMVDTERDYYRDLEILNTLYLQPLKKGRVLPETELSLIFSTLPTLLSVNKSLLEALQARVDEYRSDGDSDGDEFCIGDIWLHHTDYLKLYGTFCSRQAEALRAIRRNRASNATFQTFILKAQNKPQSRRLDLKSFLIKPVQRLCQYPLLLQELLKHTPEAHKDRNNLELALEKLLAITEHVNETSERAYSIAKVIELRSAIQGLHNLELINPKRGFVGEASFTELNKKRQAEKTLHLFLFTDCLLISEPLKGATSKIQQATRAATNARASIRFNEPLYAFKQYFLLHEVIFKDIADSSLPLLQMTCVGKGKILSPKERARAYTYDLAHGASHRTLSAKNLKEKAKWMGMWTKAKQDHDERKKQRSKVVYEAAKKKGFGDIGNGERTRLISVSVPPALAAPISPPSVPRRGSREKEEKQLEKEEPSCSSTRSRSDSVPPIATETTSIESPMWSSAPAASTSLSGSPRDDLSKTRGATKAKEKDSSGSGTSLPDTRHGLKSDEAQPPRSPKPVPPPRRLYDDREFTTVPVVPSPPPRRQFPLQPPQGSPPEESEAEVSMDASSLLEVHDDDDDAPARPPRPLRLQASDRQRGYYRTLNMQIGASDYSGSCTSSTNLSEQLAASQLQLAHPVAASPEEPTSEPCASSVAPSAESADGAKTFGKSLVAHEGAKLTPTALRRGTFGPMDGTFLAFHDSQSAKPEFKDASS